MNAKPYVIYPNATELAKVRQIGVVISKCYIDEPGQTSFGVIDYLPRQSIALHQHQVWELIIIDNGSQGPGYVFFDGHWWIVDPGSSVFIPRGNPHAWSSGKKGFKMLWIYGGSTEEAAKTYDADPHSFSAISRKQEENAPRWKVEVSGK